MIVTEDVLSLTWFNWIVLMPFINLFDYFVLVFLRFFFVYLFILFFFFDDFTVFTLNYPLHLVLRCNTPAP